MQFLPYLAAQQAVQRLSSEQFEPARERIQDVAPTRLDNVRVSVAVLLRRTADRVEPAGVTSSS